MNDGACIGMYEHGTHRARRVRSSASTLESLETCSRVVLRLSESHRLGCKATARGDGDQKGFPRYRMAFECRSGLATRGEGHGRARCEVEIHPTKPLLVAAICREVGEHS
jgi:hypothetical protein